MTDFDGNQIELFQRRGTPGGALSLPLLLHCCFHRSSAYVSLPYCYPWLHSRCCHCYYSVLIHSYHLMLTKSSESLIELCLERLKFCVKTMSRLRRGGCVTGHSLTIPGSSLSPIGAVWSSSSRFQFEKDTSFTTLNSLSHSSSR